MNNNEIFLYEVNQSKNWRENDDCNAVYAVVYWTGLSFLLPSFLFWSFFSFQYIFVQHFTSDTRAFGRFKTHRLFNRRQFNSIHSNPIHKNHYHGSTCAVRPILWPKNQAACACVLVQMNQWPFVFHYYYLWSSLTKYERNAVFISFLFTDTHTRTLTKKGSIAFATVIITIIINGVMRVAT